MEEHDQSVAQCAPAGVSKMRNLYERAISAAGLHVTEGSKIWDAYREFEEAILLTIDDSNSEVHQVLSSIRFCVTKVLSFYQCYSLLQFV